MDSIEIPVALNRVLADAQNEIISLRSIVAEQEDYITWLSKEYEALQATYEQLRTVVNRRSTDAS